MLKLYIDGKDARDVRMTQNGVGEYFYSPTLGYAPVAMKDFESYKKTYNRSKYRLYSNGSHSWRSYRGIDILMQKAVDLSAPYGSKLTANQDFTITKIVISGTSSFVYGRFSGGGLGWFVHSDNRSYRVGQVVKAGEVIAVCRWHHFHIYFTKQDFWKWYLNQSERTMDLSKGKNIELTSATNVRVGDGLNYKVKALAEKGTVFTIIGDAPRSKNGYTWVDGRFRDGMQGWIANLNAKNTNRKATAHKLPTGKEPAVIPEDRSAQYKKEIMELEKRINMVERENKALKTSAVASNKELERSRAFIKAFKEFVK